MYFYFFEDDKPQGKDVAYSEATFEDIKHIDEDGNEFWYARELQKVLTYKRWDKFNDVIDRAKEACENSGVPVSECFSHVGKTSPIYIAVFGQGKLICLRESI